MKIRGWTVLLLAACVAAWFESAEVRPVVPATAQAAVQGSDSL